MANQHEKKMRILALIAGSLLVVFMMLVLFVQYLFNKELEILYRETGELTKLTSSYIACVIYLFLFLMVIIFLYASSGDCLNDRLLRIALSLVYIIFPIAIWSCSSSIYGLFNSTNVRVRILLAAPVSTLLTTPILLAFLSLLSRKNGDEPKPFPFILWFPLLSLLSGYFVTFGISYIPIYSVFIGVYCFVSALLYVGSLIFLGFSHPVKSVYKDIMDLFSGYDGSSSGGLYGGSSYTSSSSSSVNEEVPDYILDDIAHHIDYEARPTLSDAHISGISVKQNGSDIVIHLKLDFSFNESYSENDAKRRAHSESETISNNAIAIAKDRLNYYEIDYIDNIQCSYDCNYEFYE